MNATTAFDIRYPIGGLFLMLGTLLVFYGMFAQGANTPLGANIDLWWGLVMAVFGVLLLALARASDLRRTRTASTVEPSIEES